MPGAAAPFSPPLPATERQQPEKDKQNVDVSPLEKFLRTSIATFTLSTSFDVWVSQAKLTMYDIED